VSASIDATQRSHLSPILGSAPDVARSSCLSVYGLKGEGHAKCSQPEFVGLLVDDEWLYRENRKLSSRLKLAKFKERAAYAKIGFCNSRKIAGSAPRQNLLIIGPSGWGKSVFLRRRWADTHATEERLA